MALLVEKFAKLYSKLENRHHHDLPQHEELSSSLHAFKSHVSKFIAQLALDLKPGSEIFSLSCIGRCFCFFPMINKAFAKLIVDIDYPTSKWEVDSIEGYLNYTLSLLELLNSMSSSLSHLGHARLFLAHGLTLVENSPSLATKHLKSIQPGCFTTDFGKEFRSEEYDEAKIFLGKEGIVHEAVKEMKIIGLWVCGVLLSGLYSDGKPYTELRKIAGGLDSSPVFTLDLRINEQIVGKMPIFTEVKQLNIAVAELLVASDEGRHDAAKEVKTKLHDFETTLDDISKEVDDLFANVMAQRSQLIDCSRLKKQSEKSIVRFHG